MSYAIDKEIELIIADETPVTEADRAGILECELGIAKGKNRMLAASLAKSLKIMKSYKRMGYGGDVYMSTLCEAIRHAERALLNFSPAEQAEEQTR